MAALEVGQLSLQPSAKLSTSILDELDSGNKSTLQDIIKDLTEDMRRCCEEPLTTEQKLSLQDTALLRYSRRVSELDVKVPPFLQQAGASDEQGNRAQPCQDQVVDQPERFAREVAERQRLQQQCTSRVPVKWIDEILETSILVRNGPVSSRIPLASNYAPLRGKTRKTSSSMYLSSLLHGDDVEDGPSRNRGSFAGTPIAVFFPRLSMMSVPSTSLPECGIARPELADCSFSGFCADFISFDAAIGTYCARPFDGAMQAENASVHDDDNRPALMSNRQDNQSTQTVHTVAENDSSGADLRTEPPMAPPANPPCSDSLHSSKGGLSCEATGNGSASVGSIVVHDGESNAALGDSHSGVVDSEHKTTTPERHEVSENLTDGQLATPAGPEPSHVGVPGDTPTPPGAEASKVLTTHGSSTGSVAEAARGPMPREMDANIRRHNPRKQGINPKSSPAPHFATPRSIRKGSGAGGVALKTRTVTPKGSSTQPISSSADGPLKGVSSGTEDTSWSTCSSSKENVENGGGDETPRSRLSCTPASDKLKAVMSSASETEISVTTKGSYPRPLSDVFPGGTRSSKENRSKTDVNRPRNEFAMTEEIPGAWKMPTTRPADRPRQTSSTVAQAKTFFENIGSRSSTRSASMQTKASSTGLDGEAVKNVRKPSSSSKRPTEETY